MKRYIPKQKACRKFTFAGLLVVLALSACTNDDLATGNATISNLKIADANLMACVLEEADQHGWSRSGEITKLQCNDDGGGAIRNLNGIENLVNLQTLNLERNQISETRVIGELHHLEYLDLSFNQIKFVEFGRPQSTIKSLNIDYNEIADVTWLPTFTNLEHLSIGHNDLFLVPGLAGAGHLKTLNLSHNHIESIESLERLDRLENVDVSSNKITNTSAFAGHDRIRVLLLGSNRVSEIGDLQRLPNLEELDLSDNQVGDAEPLSKILSLKVLNLRNNELSYVSPLETLVRLEQVNIEGNNLTCVATDNLRTLLSHDTIFVSDCMDSDKSLRKG